MRPAARRFGCVCNRNLPPGDMSAAEPVQHLERPRAIDLARPAPLSIFPRDDHHLVWSDRVAPVHLGDRAVASPEPFQVTAVEQEQMIVADAGRDCPVRHAPSHAENRDARWR